MSMQDAINFFKEVYADENKTGVISSMAKLEGTSRWASMVGFAMGLNYSLKPDEVKSAYQRFNSWIFTASNPNTDEGKESPAVFFFAHVNFDKQEVLPAMSIRDNGQVIGAHLQAVLDGSNHSAQTGHDDPATLAHFNHGWTISVTDEGNLAFRLLTPPIEETDRDGEPKMFITPDGHIWSAYINGYLEARNSADDHGGNELRVMLPPSSAKEVYQGWTLCITNKDCFAFQKDGQTQAYITPDGDVWSAGAGGFLKAVPGSREPVQVIPMSGVKGVALVVAAGYVLMGRGFNSAVDWTAGAAEDAFNWTKGAADSIANFSVETGTDVAHWTVKAATDATSWTGDIASKAWKATSGVIHKAGSALKHLKFW